MEKSLEYSRQYLKIVPFGRIIFAGTNEWCYMHEINGFQYRKKTKPRFNAPKNVKFMLI